MVIPFRSDGIVVKVLDWMDDRHLFIILPIIGILVSIGAFIWSGHRTIPDPEPISINAERGDYCYIDVQLLSNWVLKTSDDAGNETYYYLATDSENCHYIVTMFESQFSEFSDIVEFTEGRITTSMPDIRRTDGIVKLLTPEEAESFAEALGLSAEEFDEIFGGKFIDFTEDPDTIFVGAFIWVLGLSILMLCFKGIAALDEFTERRKQRKKTIR